MNREQEQRSTRDLAAAMNDRKDDEARRATAAATVPHDEQQALFPESEVSALRSRWEAIQTGFVDEPKAAVTEADALVAQVITRLADVFSQEKATLEQQWGRGDQVSTEDLRVALRRYRSFFSRLLAV
jgi:hypothetical protein